MGVPAPYARMRAEHPDLINAYESFVEACAKAGPLDVKTVALVKLAISMGAGLEGAAHSHARKAKEDGWSGEQLLHVATLSAPTIGFPSMMRNRGWVQEAVGEGERA